MNLLPTVILYKIFISNNIRLPDRHKIIFHRNFYRNFSHILQLIKVFRCLTHDIPPLRLYIISIDLFPTTNISITFGFKSKLNRSFIMDNITQTFFCRRFRRIGRIFTP